MSLSLHPSGVLRATAVIGLIGMQTGCTSVLTTASLRELVWKPSEHAAAADSDAAPPADTPSGPTSGADATAALSDASRRTAAIEEAIARLARLGRLDAATEATLVETLQRTQPEDWPVVVEAFAAALPPPEPARPEASAPQDAESESATAGGVPEAATTSSSAPTASATPHAVARPVAIGPTAVRPATPGAAEFATSAPPTPLSAPEPQDEPTASSRPISLPAGPRADDGVAVESRPSLRLQNACFASRVRGWGDVERFAGQRFEAGQEVIVYFELDGLAAAETAAGCTTRIDTVLALHGPDGERIHTWRFDPLEETCPQRRRDYFARYLVVLPANASGRCRLEVSVGDAVAAQTAGGTLPLDIVPAAHAR